ncbi:hypothetical protein BOTBODRAFT_186213 [Botryobasidium botryosum FD-172 SS1]|uniref:CFEM domain-containing protein n=1 Tax=Botryobasidium botryosum (strain FD-172 SS1) TaxID=930990 RepID=A0A067MYR0_BOTB1|nr:hypothetical protein BOTBODRAFT_186213 [Botryobasidium botryosum FD-172 SS1]
MRVAAFSALFFATATVSATSIKRDDSSCIMKCSSDAATAAGCSANVQSNSACFCASTTAISATATCIQSTCPSAADEAKALLGKLCPGKTA